MAKEGLIREMEWIKIRSKKALYKRKCLVYCKISGVAIWNRGEIYFPWDYESIDGGFVLMGTILFNRLGEWDDEILYWSPLPKNPKS